MDFSALSELLAASEPQRPLEAPAQVKVAVKSRADAIEAARAKKENIWTDKDIARAPEPAPDGRKRPSAEILHRQKLGAEDVFFNLGDKDASIDRCDTLVVRVAMPGAKFCDISLDVRIDSMIVQSADYYLSLPLPAPVKKDDGKAKWDKSRSELEVILPIALHVKYVTDPSAAYFEN